MQSDSPYNGPQMQPSQPPSYSVNPKPAPDYSFLNEQPKKPRLVTGFGRSFLGKIVLILIVASVLIILLIVFKNIISPPTFNKNDYVVLVERQNEMIHLVTSDITPTAALQLSTSQQNFASTADLSLSTAQSKTLLFLSDYKDKVDSQKLAGTYSQSIDQELTNSLSSNSFSSTFSSIMQQQLSSYEKELKTTYSSTTNTNGKSLILSEYQEAKQLVTALNESSS